MWISDAGLHDEYKRYLACMPSSHTLISTPPHTGCVVVIPKHPQELKPPLSHLLHIGHQVVGDAAVYAGGEQRMEGSGLKWGGGRAVDTVRVQGAAAAKLTTMTTTTTTTHPTGCSPISPLGCAPTGLK